MSGDEHPNRAQRDAEDASVMARIRAGDEEALAVLYDRYATLAPYADEQTVYPSTPLPPDAGAYALSFTVPMDAPGLVFLCRDSGIRPCSTNILVLQTIFHNKFNL